MIEPLNEGRNPRLESVHTNSRSCVPSVRVIAFTRGCCQFSPIGDHRKPPYSECKKGKSRHRIRIEGRSPVSKKNAAPKKHGGCRRRNFFYLQVITAGCDDGRRSLFGEISVQRRARGISPVRKSLDDDDPVKPLRLRRAVRIDDLHARLFVGISSLCGHLRAIGPRSEAELSNAPKKRAAAPSLGRCRGHSHY